MLQSVTCHHVQSVVDLGFLCGWCLMMHSQFLIWGSSVGDKFFFPSCFHDLLLVWLCFTVCLVFFEFILLGVCLLGSMGSINLGFLSHSWYNFSGPSVSTTLFHVSLRCYWFSVSFCSSIRLHSIYQFRSKLIYSFSTSSNVPLHCWLNFDFSCDLTPDFCSHLSKLSVLCDAAWPPCFLYLLRQFPLVPQTCLQ